MGTDMDVVQAARVSFGPSTKKIQEDRDLLRYLMRHFHETPFEMCEIKLRCKMPIFVARQWIRTRTANVNEMSLRYTEAPEEFYVPSLETISLQSRDNKQGRDFGTSLPEETKQRVLDLMRKGQDLDWDIYETLVKELGIAKELARTVLPSSLYTQWIWKIDLRNLLHFLELRLDPHAQWEIRAYAEAMAEIVKAWVPLTWEAFEDYRLEAMTLTRHEIAGLRKLLGSALQGLSPQAQELHQKGDLPGLGKRELSEFLTKLEKLQGA